MKLGATVGWILSLACFAVMAFAASQPLPPTRSAAGDRVVTDQRHRDVHIATPFRGAVLTEGAYVPRYLEITREPETLLAVTSPAMGNRVTGHVIEHIFPHVMDAILKGSSAVLSRSFGPKTPVERLLLFDPGVFMGWYTLADPVERAGMPFVGFKPFPANDDERFDEVRIYAAVVDEKAHGEDIIRYDQELFHQLDRELQADELADKPTYLYLGSRRDGGFVSVLGNRNHYTRLFLPHAGVMNSCSCPGMAAIVDAEHIAAFDPDFIVLDAQNRESPSEFANDPRWRGLRAVQNRRIYLAPSGLEYYIAPLFWSRWLAELAHPEHLKPRTRALYQDYVQWLLGYRLSDEELDTAFQVEANRGMANAARFERGGSGQ
jgi:iron complex transport system substrate-binding protein